MIIKFFIIITVCLQGQTYLKYKFYLDKEPTVTNTVSGTINPNLSSRFNILTIITIKSSSPTCLPLSPSNRHHQHISIITIKSSSTSLPLSPSNHPHQHLCHYHHQIILINILTIITIKSSSLTSLPLSPSNHHHQHLNYYHHHIIIIIKIQHLNHYDHQIVITNIFAIITIKSLSSSSTY